MKRIIAAFLVLIMVLSLCACKSREVTAAEELIGAVGEASLDSLDAITAAEAAVAALSEEDKAKVENLAVLTAAREQYDILAAADSVEKLIAAIGEVTLDSEAAIAEAETAYAALSEEGRGYVPNAADLTAARIAYEEAVYDERILTLTGNWYNEVIGNQEWPTSLEDTDCEPAYVNEYGICADELCLYEDGTFSIQDAAGVWTLSEDLASVTLTLCGDTELTCEMAVTEEDGFTKLLGELFENKFFAYVKDTDYQAAFEAKYAAVELTGDNFRDYIGDCQNMGTTETGDGTLYLMFYPSNAYDDGLVYLGCSCVVVENAVLANGSTRQINSSFPVVSGSYDKINSFSWTGSASGHMFYVKADHVAENYINEEGFRVLELTNGAELVFNGYWKYYDIFWTLVDADYADNIY